MASEDGGRKRTRSWSEIDKSKNKGGPRAARPPSRDEQRAQASAAEVAKKSIDALFGGTGEMTAEMAKVLDPTGDNARRKAALKHMQELEAKDRKAFMDAALAYTKEFELPDDPYLLDTLLDHPRATVVDKSLGKLEQLLADGKLLKRPKSLVQRLKAVELLSMDDEQKARAKALREKL